MGASGHRATGRRRPGRRPRAVIVKPGDRSGAATRRHCRMHHPARPASAQLAGRTEQSLLFLSTSDTDLLLLSRVAAHLPDGFGAVEARNPARLESEQVAALEASIRAGGRWAVAVRL